MDTPQGADTRRILNVVQLPRGWTEHSPGKLPRPALTGLMLDDRFEVMGRLGEGGMGDLYLGDDRLLRCKVAIKILRDDSPDARQRFLREAEVLSNVHHENLIDVTGRGFVQPGGMPYTALRYLPGEDLKTRLLEGGPLAWATVVEIGLQISDALACLHDGGVLHRDVKPENIMWTHHTSRRVFVKLIDLGAARTSVHFQARQDRSYTPVCGRRETTAGAAIGTPAYMPPEAGLQDPDVRTDVFALGVTLYQLCTGKMPDDPLTPTPVRAANPDAQIPEDLERVIMAALHWDRDERTPSAAHLNRELRGLRAVHTPAHDEDGLFAGRIELREHLATGAEAEVFRAYHAKLRRPVALKRMLERLQGNPDDRVRFEREAWVLASLHHPGLPEVYDSGAADGRAYTVMELCAGRPAQRFCDDTTRLRLTEVLMVGIQVAEALQAVHAIGVIHRDLSAQNILIEAGREPRVKVIDFTGCLLTDRFFSLRDEPRPTGELEVTRDRALHMLPFAAPEVRADQRWSERSDVYALGVLLYRLLSGKLPFTTQARDKYIPLPRVAHAREIDRALEAMLRPDPEQRLPNMAAVVERLRELLEEEAETHDVTQARPQLTLVTAAAADPEAPPAASTAVADAGAQPEADPVAANTATPIDPTPADEPPAPPPATLSARLATAPSLGTTPGAARLLLLAGGLAVLGLLWALSPTSAPSPAGPPAPRVAPTNTAPRAAPVPIDTPPVSTPPANELEPHEAPAVVAEPPAASPAELPGARPQLRASAVKKLLATDLKACAGGEWLTVKLRVASGIGHVETVNGFAHVGELGRCVTAAVAAAHFPNAAPATFTLQFAPDQ